MLSPFTHRAAFGQPSPREASDSVVLHPDLPPPVSAEDTRIPVPTPTPPPQKASIDPQALTRWARLQAMLLAAPGARVRHATAQAAGRAHQAWAFTQAAALGTMVGALVGLVVGTVIGHISASLRPSPMSRGDKEQWVGSSAFQGAYVGGVMLGAASFWFVKIDKERAMRGYRNASSRLDRLAHLMATLMGRVQRPRATPSIRAPSIEV